MPIDRLYLTSWSMAAAILLHEWRETHRIDRYSLLGAGWIFVEGMAHEAVVGSHWFDAVGAAVLSMVHYR